MIGRTAQRLLGVECSWEGSKGEAWRACSLVALDLQQLVEQGQQWE